MALGGLGLPAAFIVLVLFVLLLAVALQRSAPRETPTAPQDGEYRSDGEAPGSAERSVAESDPTTPPLPQDPGRTGTPGRKSRGRRNRLLGLAGRSRSSTASHTGCWSLPSRYCMYPGPAPPRC